MYGYFATKDVKQMMSKEIKGQVKMAGIDQFTGSGWWMVDDFDDFPDGVLGCFTLTKRS